MNNKEKLGTVLVVVILVKIATVFVSGFTEMYYKLVHGIRAPLHEQLFSSSYIGTTGYYILVLFSIALLLSLVLDFEKKLQTYLRVVGAIVVSILALSIILSDVFFHVVESPRGFESHTLLLGCLFLLATFLSSDWYSKIFKRYGYVFVFTGVVTLLFHWLISSAPIFSTTGLYEDFWGAVLYGFIMTYIGFKVSKESITPIDRGIRVGGLLSAFAIIYSGWWQL